MRRFVLLLLRQAFAWPCQSVPSIASPRVATRGPISRAPSAAACRRAWGKIRALYPLKDLVVPA